MNGTCQEGHNTISKWGRKNCTSECDMKNAWTSQKKHVLNTMFILEYSLTDLNSERNLEEQLKNEKNPCDDLDEASRWDNAENLELRKRKKMKRLEPRKWHDEQLWKEETRSLGWNNNKNYVMHILCQFKLMTSNGFGIPLILLEKDWEVTGRKLEKVFMNHR